MLLEEYLRKPCENLKPVVEVETMTMMRLTFFRQTIGQLEKHKISTLLGVKRAEHTQLFDHETHTSDISVLNGVLLEK